MMSRRSGQGCVQRASAPVGTPEHRHGAVWEVAVDTRGNARLTSQFRWLRVLYKKRSDVQIGRKGVGLSAARSVLGVVMILRPKFQRVLLLTFAAGGSAALPQTAPAEPAAQPPVVLRATPHRVQVNVIVR